MSDLPVSRDASIVDLLDRLLDKGVVLSGDVTIAVADVDLVYLGLRVLLSSADTAQRFGAPVPGSAALHATPAEGDALGSRGTADHPFDDDALTSAAARPAGSGPQRSAALNRDALDSSSLDKRLRDHPTQPDAGGIDERHAGGREDEE